MKMRRNWKTSILPLILFIEIHGANTGRESRTKNERISSQKRDRRLGNWRLAKKILPGDKFPKLFRGLDDPYTYKDFLSAVGQFPVCSQSHSCHKELAAMGVFADKARCAGIIVT